MRRLLLVQKEILDNKVDPAFKQEPAHAWQKNSTTRLPMHEARCRSWLHSSRTFAQPQPTTRNTIALRITRSQFNSGLHTHQVSSSQTDCVDKAKKKWWDLQLHNDCSLVCFLIYSLLFIKRFVEIFAIVEYREYLRYPHRRDGIYYKRNWMHFGYLWIVILTMSFSIHRAYPTTDFLE